MTNLINEELRKALTIDNGGAVLINEKIEREIHDLVIADSPLLNRVTRRSWPTNTFKYRVRTAGPGAGFIADGATMVTAGKSTWTTKSVDMKYIYSRVEVSGPTQYSVRDHMDLLAEEIQNGATDLSRTLEETLVYGDDSVTGHEEEFDGLLTQITTNNLDLGTDDGSGGTTLGSLYLSDIDEALDKPHRSPTTLAGERALGRRINALLRAQERFIEHIDVDGGFTVATYRGMPIYTVDNDFIGSDLDNTVVLFDHRKVQFVVQRDTFIEPLAKTKDTDDYMVGMYCTLAVIDEAFHHAKITNASFEVSNE